MVELDPVTELSAFSSADASPTQWAMGRRELRNAEIYWLTTIRPEGRPHVTPLLGIWLDGASYICTGATERKAKNLAQNPHCILTTGCNGLDGLDLVIEGEATKVSDPAELASIADTFEVKYGAHFTAPEGTWFGLGDSIRRDEVAVYRIAPSTPSDSARAPYSAKRGGSSPKSPSGDRHSEIGPMGCPPGRPRLQVGPRATGMGGPKPSAIAPGPPIRGSSARPVMAVPATIRR